MRKSMLLVASPATWGHGEVPAHTAAEGHARSVAMQQQELVPMSVACITTGEHGDVPSLGSHLGPYRCPKAELAPPVTSCGTLGN